MYLIQFLYINLKKCDSIVKMTDLINTLTRIVETTEQRLSVLEYGLDNIFKQHNEEVSHLTKELERLQQITDKFQQLHKQGCVYNYDVPVGYLSLRQILCQLCEEDPLRYPFDTDFWATRLYQNMSTEEVNMFLHKKNYVIVLGNKMSKKYKGEYHTASPRKSNYAHTSSIVNGETSGKTCLYPPDYKDFIKEYIQDNPLDDFIDKENETMQHIKTIIKDGYCSVCKKSVKRHYERKHINTKRHKEEYLKMK